MPGDNVVISMLGDAQGGGAGGFAVLDAKTFELKGRWEDGGERPPLNYDFWYQPRKNVVVSSEFGEPNAYEPGFDLDDVGAGRYGRRLHFWNLEDRKLEQTVDLGDNGLIPLEVRWLHDPDAEQGFVGAALSSTMWHFHRGNGSWKADQVIAVESIPLEGWPVDRIKDGSDPRSSALLDEGPGNVRPSQHLHAIDQVHPRLRIHVTGEGNWPTLHETGEDSIGGSSPRCGYSDTAHRQDIGVVRGSGIERREPTIPVVQGD